MKRRRNGDSEFDGDLIDPSMDANQAGGSASPASQPNPHGPVYVGGGEREARAYVAPVPVPLIAAPKAAADKVAIASSVDPRRMQTMRLAPGRPRAPLTPEEQQLERPGQMTEEANPHAPSSRYPTSGAQISHRPPKSPMASTIVRTPPPAQTNNGPPLVIWILAVALAALIGAGTALWIRKNSATPAPAPAPAAAPKAPATTNR
jgi:hypothetical protein